MKKIILIAVFVAFIVVCAAGWFAWQRKVPLSFWDRVIPLPSGDKISIMIYQNQTTQEIIKNFVDGGAVRGSGAEFSRWLAKFGLDRKLVPGKYEIVPSSAWDAARQMRTVKPIFYAATIIPGSNKYDIYLSGDIKKELLNNSLYPKEMLAILPASEEGRIAFLLPETYLMPEFDAQELIRMASGAWWKEFGSLIPRTPEEAKKFAIIAALIEREALWDEERPKIAGVIYNRIAKKMLLQIDAAVVYAHRIAGRKLTRVFFKDLEIESPYNLYRYAGLTPEPICVPSRLSWTAAVEPEQHNLLYYVADKDGRHIFGKTNEEHLQNIRKVRQ